MGKTKYQRMMTEMFLSEKLPKNPVAADAKAKGLVWRHGNAYGPDTGDGTADVTTYLNINGKLVPVEDAPDDQKDTTTSSPNPGAPAKKIVPQQYDARPTTSKSDAGPVEITRETRNEFIGKVRKRAMIAQSHDKSTDKYNVLAAPMAKFYDRLEKIANLAPSKRKAALETLLSDYPISFSANGGLRLTSLPQVGATNLPAWARKPFGDPSTTALTGEGKFFLQLLDDAGLSPQPASKKQVAASVSKPTLGNPHYADTDIIVNSVFSSSKPLERMADNFKSVFGPSDANGNIIRSGGENAKSFFEHSINNDHSLEMSIDVLYGDNPEMYQRASLVVNVYKKNMQRILENFDVNPNGPYTSLEQRENAVTNAFNDVVTELYEMDKVNFPSIMPNLAEMNLYNQEIAQGKEVYLPAKGNFPAADKIVVTQDETFGERIDYISIKFGESQSGGHGRLTKASALALWHEDPKYQDMFGRGGKRNALLGVGNEILLSPDSQMTILAKKIGFDKVFGEDGIAELKKIGSGLVSSLITYASAPGSHRTSTSDLTTSASARVPDSKAYKMASDKIGDLLDRHGRELVNLIGENNYKSLLSDPPAIFGFMQFNGMLKDGNGLNALKHNRQKFSDDGHYVSETINGSSDIKDWIVNFSLWSKSGRGMEAGLDKNYNGVPI